MAQEKNTRAWWGAGGLAALVLVFTVLMIAASSAVAQEAAPEATAEPAVIIPTASAGDVVHTVQAGDVLERIGALYDASVACIIETNAVEQSGNLLFVGQTLVISATCPPYQGTLPVENPRFGDLTDEIIVPDNAAPIVVGNTYTIQVADTLDTIGQEFNVSVVAIFAANGLDYGSLIYPGQQIIVPDAPPYGFYPGLVSMMPGEGGGAEGMPARGEAGDVYVIQPQDALDLIAAYFDKDLRCVMDTNGITDPTSLQPGTIIVIPFACQPYAGLSSAPLRPPRGVGIAGASALLVETGENVNGEPVEGIAPPVGGEIEIPEATEEAAAPIEATATPESMVSTPIPVLTATPFIMRGPTITPTPSG